MPIPPSAARSERVANQTLLSAKNIKSLGAAKPRSTKLGVLQTSNKTIASAKSLSSAKTKTSAAKKALEKKLLAKQLQAKKAQGKKAQGQKPLGKKPQGKKSGGKKPQGDKPQGGKPGSKPSGSKPLSGKDPQDSPSDREPQPKGTITTDEDGNEHFDGTIDEQLAFNNGGTYEWTDADGNHHVTEVSEEGTYREVTSADGMSTAASFTPHERRDATTDDDDGGAGGGAWDVVDQVVTNVNAFIPGLGYWRPGLGYYDPGVGYYDPGYVIPTGAGYVIPADAGYLPPAYEAELIPATSAGASDQAVVQFTRRLLHVTNNTDAPITVYVQFEARNERGEWLWLPADPAAAPEALRFELAAGQGGYLEHQGVPILASRVRIWAQSGARQWLTHQHEDLWLVPELDAGGARTYYAAALETFPFEFE